MTLRKKTILLMALTFVVLIAIILLVLQVTMVRRFQQYEREEMAEEAHRALSVLAVDLENLDVTLKDWSIWDDSYAFLEDGGEDYIGSNLAYESLRNIRVNVILFVRPSGEVLYGVAYDFTGGGEVPLPEALSRHLDPSDRLVDRPAGEGTSTGIMMIDGTPLLVAAGPVLTSLGEGPSRGTLVMGSYLDDERVERLGRMASLDLSVLPVDDPGAPRPTPDAPHGSPGAKPVFTQPLDGSRIAGYAPVNDLYGDPALLIRVEAERDLYQHGQVLSRYLILILLGVVLAFAGAVLIELERSVLRPLARFSSRVSEIDTEHDLTQRLGVGGKDELARLAGAIDTMLDNLQRAEDERRGSELALRESEEKYRKLMETAGDAIFIVDPDSGIILESNQRAEELTGRSAQELAGMHQALLHPPEEEEAYREIFATHAREGQGFLAEAVVVRKDGGRVPVEISARVVEIEGRRIAQGIFRDITERKRAEGALRESARQLRDFFTIAAHELRHPVTVIVGYAETLAGNLEKVPRELLPEIAAAIRSSAGRLNGVMDDLLDVSRVEGGAYTASKKAASLGPLFERALEKVRARGLENPVFIHVSRAVSRAEVDPKGLMRVMVILLDNAVKFSPPGSPVEVHAESDGEGTLVSVLDRGMGVAPEAAVNIFEPAFQVEEVLHHSIPGMGMGLYIAREIVEAHGGRIWHEPREGGGSAFRFKLPRCGIED